MSYVKALRRELDNAGKDLAIAVGSLPDRAPIVELDETADVSGGGTTAVVGLQLKDAAGRNVERAVKLTFGVYDDADADGAASNATLATATAGSIVSGGGTAELVILTSATGKFTCTLTDASDETVYLAAGLATPGGALADCMDRESVAFSA